MKVDSFLGVYFYEYGKRGCKAINIKLFIKLNKLHMKVNIVLYFIFYKISLPIIKRIAKIKGVSPEIVADITYNNAMELFNILWKRSAEVLSIFYIAFDLYYFHIYG